MKVAVDTNVLVRAVVRDDPAQADVAAAVLTERSGGNGAVAVFMACYDCFFVQSMPRASKQQARYAVGRCLMLWSSNDVTQQGSRPKTKLATKKVP